MYKQHAVPTVCIEPEQFDTLYNVNVRAQFFLTQAVLPAMIKQHKGVVINVSSTHAYSAYREHTVYAGTKGAIVAYTRTLAIELAPKGIRDNAIAPGWIAVENQRIVMGDDFDWEAAAKTLPSGFISTPADMGRLMVWLASDEARYIIGQTIIADGGQSSIMPLTGDFQEPISEQFGQGYVPGL